MCCNCYVMWGDLYPNLSYCIGHAFVFMFFISLYFLFSLKNLAWKWITSKLKKSGRDQIIPKKSGPENNWRNISTAPSYLSLWWGSSLYLLPPFFKSLLIITTNQKHCTTLQIISTCPTFGYCSILQTLMRTKVKHRVKKGVVLFQPTSTAESWSTGSRKATKI